MSSIAKSEAPEGMVLPVLPLRGLVIFPGMMLQFDVGRKKSVAALTRAMEQDQKVLLVAQKDLEENDPTGKQIYRMGVLAKIKQMITHSEGGVRIFAEGRQRARLLSVVQENPFLAAEYETVKTRVVRQSYRAQAVIRQTRELFEEYVQNYHRVPPDIILGVLQQKDCGQLADYVAANILLDYDLKQQLLEELHPVRRLEKLNHLLREENQILSIEAQISERAKEQMDQNQRDYFLREQMKAIAYELGEDDNPQEEAEEYRERIEKEGLPELQANKLYKECDRLAKMPAGSHESSVIRTYLDTCLELPWNKASKEKIDLARAKKILDRDHYGLEKVKDRILETLAVRKLAPENHGQILCLVGPPGVGKTSVARSIAEATGRKYVRVSLGGVRDESDIMGHRRTYVGAMPGRIIAALKQAGTNNPLILLDEIDKLGRDFRGDPASALLEVLDAEQNTGFQDHYIDMPFDLSHVLFLTTANDPTTIPEPLYDRMDVITLSSYTHEEKFHIATKHLIPKQLKKHGITAKMLRITPQAVHDVISGYTREAGVRTLERTIAAICRKCAKQFVEGTAEKVTVAPKDLEELLGPKKFKEDALGKVDEIGLVNGLAWTSVGGETMPIEVAVMDGTGKLELTGSLGDVMKESAHIAVSCVRMRAAQYGIRSDFYSKCDIHVHVPAGAIPKDGPSAGIALATAITSALSCTPVRHDLAMTGEITLRGRVLPIGGLKEKTMAAYRAGIKKVLIPADNEPDLAEVDQEVKKTVQFRPVKDLAEVLEEALAYQPKPLSEDAGDGQQPCQQPVLLPEPGRETPAPRIPQ